MTEKKILSEFRHPYLVHLFSTFETQSHVYFCLEPLLGGSLGDIAPRGTPVAARTATFYTAEALLGLWFLHDCGVIYRDLKLENILLDSHGHLRLADFGLAKVLEEGRDTTSTLCGTPDYVAPEMIRGNEYNRAVDLWSLGVLLYVNICTTSCLVPFSISLSLSLSLSLHRVLSLQKEHHLPFHNDPFALDPQYVWLVLGWTLLVTHRKTAVTDRLVLLPCKGTGCGLARFPFRLKRENDKTTSLLALWREMRRRCLRRWTLRQQMSSEGSSRATRTRGLGVTW